MLVPMHLCVYLHIEIVSGKFQFSMWLAWIFKLVKNGSAGSMLSIHGLWDEKETRIQCSLLPHAVKPRILLLLLLSATKSYGMLRFNLWG